jgi:hypothetical protein
MDSCSHQGAWKPSETRGWLSYASQHCILLVEREEALLLPSG